jgi:hypothetical protein
MPFMPLALRVFSALAAAYGLAGCTTQQSYAVGQTWQRNECQKLPDAQERGRCLASAATSYEEYRRQADAAAKR